MTLRRMVVAGAAATAAALVTLGVSTGVSAYDELAAAPTPPPCGCHPALTPVSHGPADDAPPPQAAPDSPDSPDSPPRVPGFPKTGLAPTHRAR